MKKGNKHSTWATLGATNHSNSEREENDFYATEPKATRLLCEVEKFNPVILEPCCGVGSISEVLKDYGYNVYSYDLIYRGYGNKQEFDFLEDILPMYDNNILFDIITNPPYKDAEAFVRRSIEVIPNNCKVAMFLKLQFLEGQARRKLFDVCPPKVVYVSSARLQCAKNAEFEKYGNNAQAYAWFVWQKGFKGDPIIKWIN